MLKKILPYLITITVLKSIIIPVSFYATSPFKGKSNGMNLLWTLERSYYIEAVADLNGNGRDEIIYCFSINET